MNCPACNGVPKSFTFSTGETISRCACGHESGLEVLRQGEPRITWKGPNGGIRKAPGEAHRWWNDDDPLGREEIKLGVTVPASGAAQVLQTVFRTPRGTYFIPPAIMAVAERFRVRLPITIHCRCEIPETLGPFDPTLRYNSTPVARIKRLAELERQRKRAWRAAILRKRMYAWLSATKKFVARDDSPFSKKQTAKRERGLAEYYAHRRLYSLPDLPMQPYRVHSVDERMNRYLKDLDNGKAHESAANGVEEITHSCPPDCTCNLDWRPFVHWRPLEQPNGGLVDRVKDWISRFTLEENEIPLALTLVLKRMLWTFRATYPNDPWNAKKLFFQSRTDAGQRRLQLRSWLNGIPRPHRYAKAYECWDFKEKKGSDGKKFPKLKANLDYTIVKREHRREKKIPGYKLHDSWRDIMAHFAAQGKPISRRTAFNYIKAGFRIPRQKVTEDLLHAADL